MQSNTEYQQFHHFTRNLLLSTNLLFDFYCCLIVLYSVALSSFALWRWNIVLHLIFVMKLKLCLTPVSYTRIATRWHLHHHHQSHLLFINMQCIAVFHDFFVFYWRFWASADANIYFIFVSSTKKDTYLLRPIQITYLPVLRQNESFQLLSPSPRCSHKLPWQDEQIKLCVPKFRIVNPAFPV